LRQAHLPRLVTSRQESTLSLQWKTPHGLPFPMPVEVDIDGKRQVVPMTSGRGTVSVPAPYSVITIDPESKLLRQDDAMDAYRDDQASKKASGGN
jgi:hypothetical protein